MNPVQQLDMSYSPRASRTERKKLGLALSHRYFFDSLQDEWIVPSEEKAGFILGHGSFVRAGYVQSRNQIDVYIELEPSRLAGSSVLLRRDHRWIEGSLASLSAEDEAVFLPGAVSTFAISKLIVDSVEARARLIAMARQLSNLTLPEVELVVSDDHVTLENVDQPRGRAFPGIDILSGVDATRGAITMALWAVPRIDPWLDLLVAAIAPRASELAVRATAVGAGWWRLPAWRASFDGKLKDFQEALWVSAVQAFRALSGPDEQSVDLAEQIAQSCRVHWHASDEVSRWLDDTRRVLRGDKTIDICDWKVNPVERIVQLVLARPEPALFKTWYDDFPTIAPAIWWSAATLCGLLRGYKGLDRQFRGNSTQRELFALRALAEHAPDVSDVLHAEPSWHRESGSFVLSWGRTDFARIPEHARALWFHSDLSDESTARLAADIAKQLHWPCFKKCLILSETTVAVTGTGVISQNSDGNLRISGRVSLQLPANAEVAELIDPERFKQAIATEGGAKIPPPPSTKVVTANVDAALLMLRERTIRYEAPPGLVYVTNFITEEEEASLVDEIDRGNWLSVLQRRVQHYGWRYDYKARRIDESMRIGPLPAWAIRLGNRLVAAQLIQAMPDQVIVNEYIENQGIAKHVDCESCFVDGIAMISMLESWEMVFRQTERKSKVAHVLDRRSITVLQGDARYAWSHEIPKRLVEPNGVRRHRRLSITFRRIDQTKLLAGKKASAKKARQRQAS